MVMVVLQIAKTTQKTTMNHGKKIIELPELALSSNSTSVFS
jgi:hypothetical protein